MSRGLGDVYKRQGSDDEHGGPGWEFSTCLWSPSTDKAGTKRYEVMWEPQNGDLVLHFYKYPWEGKKAHTQFCGFSTVNTSCHIVQTDPPNPGKWLASEYYRVELHNYQPLTTRLYPEAFNQHPEYLARIRAELIPDRPDRYPFITYGELIRLTQGQYLTRCTANLYEILRDALGLESIPPAMVNSSTATKTPAGKRAKSSSQVEYQEGQRKLRETYFFARNPKLAAEAKLLRNYTCEICSFNFLHHYGELGKEFAECHHKNPLSERPEEMWNQSIASTLDDVAVVCSNCHRMLHRRRPALTIEELIAARQSIRAAV